MQFETPDSCPLLNTKGQIYDIDGFVPYVIGNGILMENVK